MPTAEDSVIYTRDKEMRETKHSRLKNIRADATKMYCQPKNARGLLASRKLFNRYSTPFTPSLRRHFALRAREDKPVSSGSRRARPPERANHS